MDNEWLARYRAHNDALQKRLEGVVMLRKQKHELREQDCAIVQEAPRAVDDVRDIQLSKLFVSRIHRIAARVQGQALRDELYDLADEIEETLASR